MINKHTIDRLYTYFKDRLGMYDYTKGWMKGTCPACGREDKFGVHLGMYRTNCFVCGYHERPLYVVCTVEGLTAPEALIYLKTFEGLEYIDPVVKEFEEKPVNLPEGFVTLDQGQGLMGKAMRGYIRNKRGLDPHILSRKGFGYCESGKLFGYLIMPFYVKGRLVYYHTRRVLGIGPKFDNPEIEEFGIGKSVLIYNIDALYYYDHIYLVESVLNAETLGDNATATGGKKVSRHQKTSYISSPCQRITIILDPDAYLEAIQLGLELVNYKRIKIVLLPEGEDVNKYGHDNTMKRVWKSRYLSYQDLLKMKHDYERAQHSHN